MIRAFYGTHASGVQIQLPPRGTPEACVPTLFGGQPSLLLLFRF